LGSQINLQDSARLPPCSTWHHHEDRARRTHIGVRVSAAHTAGERKGTRLPVGTFGGISPDAEAILGNVLGHPNRVETDRLMMLLQAISGKTYLHQRGWLGCIRDELTEDLGGALCGGMEGWLARVGNLGWSDGDGLSMFHVPD